ncbi:unnamed protein product [Oppiella nova]|uniref:Uncharacterized protein n=1 Tax=Oppiella nova TaxID=334625 RepID=A0A7R9M7B7_9ACAR|nr:unnamed protein product [Oppiella nova]CAG2172135.1 unnamed protein product [Oppiella nova]
MFSPAMVDMKFLFHSSMAAMVYTNTFFSGGYLLGSLSGFLYKYINRQLMLVFMTVILAVFTALMPFCTNIWLLYLSVFINSIGGGAWDSGNAVWTIEMWKDKSPPVLQLSQMMYGLGNILSPLIAKDYLYGDLSNDTDYEDDFSAIIPYDLGHEYPHHYPKHDHHHHPTPVPHRHTTTPLPDINYSFDRRPKLIIPFLIAGGMTLFVPESIEVIDEKPESVQKIITEKSQPLEPSRRTKFILIALVAMSLNSYSGMEQSFLNNSSTYYQYLPIRLSAQEAADVLSVMTTTYTVGRLISAFIASKLSPEVMITYHSVIICISMGILQFGQHSETLIWTGNALIGFGQCDWPSVDNNNSDFENYTNSWAVTEDTTHTSDKPLMYAINGNYDIGWHYEMTTHLMINSTPHPYAYFG